MNASKYAAAVRSSSFSLTVRRVGAARHSAVICSRLYSTATYGSPKLPDAGEPASRTQKPDIDFEVRYLAKDPVEDSPATRILDAALSQVPTHGWTTAALGEGAVSLGYPSITHGLFPRGGVELVEHFIKKSTRAMRTEMEGLDLASMKVTAKIRAACVARLRMTAPYISRWPDAVALMAQPQNVPNSLQNLGELVDEMWYIAGDRSVDMNWYSKRAMLAGVYTSTEMFMAQDKSPGFEETWKFLDRRLMDVGTVGRTVSEMSNVVDFGIKSVSGLLSSGRKAFDLSHRA
ncbi:Ubiquinone biosynthesis protein coq9, mitochondrial [Borealophlyctis nickersoniae]|nr:Ubiquinone biosynthesis protein coq9, mitochondrial [Borealophlyctis nickersoniae]